MVGVSLVVVVIVAVVFVCCDDGMHRGDSIQNTAAAAARIVIGRAPCVCWNHQNDVTNPRLPSEEEGERKSFSEFGVAKKGGSVAKKGGTIYHDSAKESIVQCISHSSVWLRSLVPSCFTVFAQTRTRRMPATNLPPLHSPNHRNIP